MGDKSGIEWTDATWTPIRARYMEIQNDGSGKERIGWHCEHVSEGCRNCYAEGINARLGTGLEFKPVNLYRPERDGYHNGEAKLFLDEKMLLAPLQWKKPRMIFVCSMTDLFAGFVPDAWIDRAFAIMALCPQHTFQVLTKRSARMREYVDGVRLASGAQINSRPLKDGWRGWPLPNVWLGVSTEDQQRADERIPDLLATPAAKRILSAEPLLGPIDLTCVRRQLAGESFMTFNALDAQDSLNKGPVETRLDWIICGGESGAGARPMHPSWARSLRDQCAAAGVPFFFKQWGEWTDHDQRGVDMLGTKDSPLHPWPDHKYSVRIGKKAAGRLLDGVEHNEMPAAAHRDLPAGRELGGPL